MPEQSEYVAMMKRRDVQTETAHVHKLRTVLPPVTEITHKAQTVTEHAGWQFFLDTLESRIAAVEAKKAAHLKGMIFGPALGQDLERLKIELNVMDAEINALRYAQNVIPDVMEHGRATQRAAVASADH